MHYTLPSRAIINILLPDIDDLIGDAIAAFSPLVSADPFDPRMKTIFTLLISSGDLRLSVPLSSTGISDRTRRRIHSRSGEIDAAVSLLLCLVSGRPAAAKIVAADNGGGGSPEFIVDLSLAGGGFLRIGIPFEFFHAFMGIPVDPSDPTSVEREIASFFIGHRSCFPHVGPLVDCLSPRELENLFHSLRLRGLLSSYQSVLLLRAFPDKADRIESALPASLVREGRELVAYRRLFINRRDLAGGVYSLEDAVFRLLNEPEPPGPLRPFRGLRAVIYSLRLRRSLPEGDFWSFCASMAASGELYEAIGLCGERTSRIALSGAPDYLADALRACVSSRTLIELLSADPGGIGAQESLEARARFASALRRARVRRISRGRMDIAYLLSRLERAVDFDTLLVESGWFRVATALKGVPVETRRRFLEGITLPARYLIEDMLDGTINPDILHDESGIRAAGDTLADRIFELVESGAIRFSA